jgi:predicted unusual protein kinase regulating ubiquinone biosynthesis (AarF/ABC1/UbiB family)
LTETTPPRRHRPTRKPAKAPAVRAAAASLTPVRARPRRSPPRTRRAIDTVALREAGLSGAAADARLELVRSQGLRLLRGAGGLALRAVRLPESTTRIVAAFMPLTRLMAQPTHIGVAELSREVDRIFAALYQHPLTEQTRRFTTYLRARNMLPNEGSTENLIRYVVNEVVARSPIPVPQKIVDEFWGFFHELMAEPELRGLADLGLDITRLVLRTYEPLLVEVINELKDIFYTNQQRSDALLRRVQVVRRDLQIIRRQIKALRYIRPFLQTDAKDFRAQAQIVAKMVREFGPFFIKMAQVAAATADFLPEEMARELTVFQEDVPPMSADEARQAIIDSFGKPPEDIYFGFDAQHPLKSGSIGSVYLAKKPMTVDGLERLVPVVVKIGRHNLDREFLMGKTSIGLMLLSSQYWAPHGKLTPFLKAMTTQIDGFIEGFRGELQFEREAAIQARFAQRALHSSVWRVPRVYASTERIIEMEYVDGAVNISRAAVHFNPRDLPAYRRELARKFLFAVLSQVFIHQEVHGDLHPGNVMVDADGALHLIDWGNTVQLAGKLAPAWRYLRGALVADADAVTDALIAICTEPDSARARRAEIREALARTLQKKQIRPLGRWFAWTLALEGPEGWLQRASMLGQLMSNTQHLGLVVRGEYLHLSRSASAMLGTLGSLYKDMPRHRVAADLLWALNSFPAWALQDALRGKKAAFRDGAVALARRD